MNAGGPTLPSGPFKRLADKPVERAVSGRLIGAVVLIAVSGLLTVTSASESLERRFGLPLLFQLRNAIAPPAVPADLFIVTPFKTPAPDQPDLLRRWDRRLHADAIERLARLEVGVVAIDITFRDPHPGEDDELARALGSLKHLVLVQHTLPPKGSLQARVLEKPLPILASAAARLAPSLIPSTTLRSDLYARQATLLYEGDEHVDTLHSRSPVQRQDLGASTDSLMGDRTRTVFNAKGQVPTLPLVALELWSEAMAEANSSSAGNSELAAESVRIGNRVHSKALSRGESNNIRLNFYGPPGTIRTFDYDELEALALAVEDERRDNPLRGATVFVGGSHDELSVQRADGHLTIFSSNDDPMAGVEMAATAFANMRDERVLSSYVDPRTTLLLTMGCLLPLLLFSDSARTRRSLILAGLLAIALTQFAVHVFANAHVWLPIVTPLSVLVGASIVVVLADLRTSNRLRDRARAELGTFVTELTLSQLDGGRACRLDQAVCLVSDVRGFTAMSEMLSVEALHEQSERYFSMLFERVATHGADVVKTYGDSMTAIWREGSAAQRRQALRAARDIIRRVENCGAQGTFPPTHIGLSCGPVVVGHVGTERRRSVELTGAAIYRASRLEQLNKTLGTTLLASDEFGPQADELGFGIREVGPRPLRGFRNQVRVIAIESIGIEKDGCAAV